MNRVASRYFGLYRPWGFKENKFMFFYTGNPVRYTMAIQKELSELNNNGFFEIARDVLELKCPPAYITFTKNAYPNFKEIHQNITKFFLEKNGETLALSKSPIKHWPVVSLKKKEMNKLNDLDNFIEEITKKDFVNKLNELLDAVNKK
ncbi:putative ORFan [Tupanvirus deep ocean]|uniref:ORFan n=2 Tax=Tupanvirus TaxID=2094720 RepID=A0AC62A7F2_9VIRU|nr:putative ORFan [Tupanvirus deep ocean]QKU33706.1 putative ORFan [Tupanvirus deep ocean]